MKIFRMTRVRLPVLGKLTAGKHTSSFQEMHGQVGATPSILLKVFHKIDLIVTGNS